MRQLPGGLTPLPETRLLNRATIPAALLAFVVFGLDLSAPPELGVPMLYVLPLLVGTLGGPPRFHVVAAVVLSALVVAGGFLAPDRAPVPVVLWNRAISLGVIWTAAAVLSRFRRTWLDLQLRTRDLQTRTKDLADVSFALDQSAIIAITDTSGTIRTVNQKFCDISKYSREELIGQDHRLLNSGHHEKAFIRDLWVTIANGRIWRGEIRNRAKDGSLYWVDTTIVPFLDARGKPYQYMAIRYEITDRKRSEERLREQEALAHLGRMAAVVAHEVKNPIAGIRGALQVIGSRLPAESRDKPIVGDIIARLDALNRIVDDMLVFARPRELKTAPVPLTMVIAATVDLLRRDPALAGLHVDVAGNGAIVDADAEQLQMVFQNVLMNAAQAMGGAGHIHVRIEQDDGMWRVAVVDEGPGMPTDVQARVFEPFFTTKSRGTGLGLPIARRVVEAHGGDLSVDSPPAGGTVVSISLPARQVDPL
jgi:two-component system CheB/CheR fusion protein